MKIRSSCAIQIYPSMTMIIGGFEIERDISTPGFASLVWTYDWNLRRWSQVSSLNTGRYYHTCFLHSSTGKFVAVGGLAIESIGSRGIGCPSSSVEVFDWNIRKWIKGE